MTLGRDRRKISRKTQRGYEDFLLRLQSSPENSQAYETLLSTLHLWNEASASKTILVTSTKPAEGKTTITVNLALMMILTGQNVLVIDADVRKPQLHHIFKLKNDQGFVDILTGNRDLKDVIQKVEVTNHAQHLSVITSGGIPENFFNNMTSLRLKEMIKLIGKIYDIILFDSSPVLSSNDPLVLASIIDGIILVLHTGMVTEREAKYAKERLDSVGGHVLGIVLNKFDEKLHGLGFHPYHNYYKYRDQ